mgnify:CR=1 FL=1
MRIYVNSIDLGAGYRNLSITITGEVIFLNDVDTLNVAEECEICPLKAGEGYVHLTCPCNTIGIYDEET